MANRALWLSQRSSHGVRETVLAATFARHDRLSEEQRTAIEHVSGSERIAAVIGRAGAGKTTMMKAAREAWEAARLSGLSAAHMPARRQRALRRKPGSSSYAVSVLGTALERGA